MFHPGQPAPDFELTSDEDQPVKLSDFRGQRIILFFFPRADTPGCTVQACGFRDNFADIRNAEGTVVGVSPDAPQDLARWKEKMNFPYTFLSDPDHEVAEMYGVWGEKSMFGRNYMGIIRSHFVIDEDGRFQDVQVNVSPTDSVERAMAVM